MYETPKRLVALIALVLGLGVVVSQPPVAPAQQAHEDRADFGGDSMVSGGSATDPEVTTPTDPQPAAIDPEVTTPTDPQPAATDPEVTTPTGPQPATEVSEPTTDSAGSAASAAGVSGPAETSATSTTSSTDSSTAQLSASGEPRAIAQAAQSSVLLGTVESVAVLAGSAVTNTGPSVISGDVDVAPACAVSGFPPGIVINGTIHRCDAVAAQAQADLTTAYNDAAGRTPTQQVATELGGQTLTTGVYRSASGTFGLTGPLTLNAQGDPNAVFIFQTESTLITASASRVVLINGAQACNVFWQVGSSATLGTNSRFVGNILALTSITANTGATVDGRLLARNGAVTLDTNTITRSVCATAVDETPVEDTPVDETPGGDGDTTGGGGDTTGGNGDTTGGNGDTTGGNGDTTGGNGDTTGGNGDTTGGNGDTTGGGTTGGGNRNISTGGGTTGEGNRNISTGGGTGGGGDITSGGGEGGRTAQTDRSRDLDEGTLPVTGVGIVMPALAGLFLLGLGAAVRTLARGQRYGRLPAPNRAVTLDTNTITRSVCATAAPQSGGDGSPTDGGDSDTSGAGEGGRTAQTDRSRGLDEGTLPLTGVGIVMPTLAGLFLLGLRAAVSSRARGLR